ncbi:zinc finger protein 687-like [Vanessa cardui]|uniref:zinc finger protein 687-like n=1 Tax=Vanessa cardui TaxID=171605 RepID=UPI001F12D56A|nr:zinc finger protein 687-like [Vanessa cardui]
MSSDINCDRLTIKNILFTKALPNYTIPVTTDGYKIFPCTDCGDKFLFESSYNDHINRKSLKITYFCRYCSKIIINKNRCRLLSHIRSHAFKTATINVSDIKIEPLPIQDINWTLPHNSQVEVQTTIEDNCNTCYECRESINRTNKIHEDRAAHYMKYTNMVYSCPVCMFSLPSICAITAHLRIHLRIPPYYCPECGIHLSTKSISYPYNHDCEGFNMIRATTRIKCPNKLCNKIIHPNDFRMHVKSHMKKVYKCLLCSVMWFNAPPKIQHYPCKTNDKLLSCFSCQICPNQLLVKNEVNKHLNFHYKHLTEQNLNHVYPCMSCNYICYELHNLINHFINKHASNEMKKMLIKIFHDNSTKANKGYYRVVKKCDKCLRSFIYRCEYESIKILPNECPYKCSPNKITYTQKETNENLQIVCYLCKNKISENWDDIKKHFAIFHKNHKCLDLKVMLTKIDTDITRPKNKSLNLKSKRNIKQRLKNKFRKINNDTKRKINIPLQSPIEHGPINENVCHICNYQCEDKQMLETHIITHRDPCMAYQCLECGQCFVVKPSFSTHLLLQHNIADVNEYINKKQCYNESALLKQPNNTNSEDEPIQENQCKICRDQFENPIDLEKHFRVHGMAFLMKNTNKNNSP